ncbi:MAG: FAD-binding oxidoreductase [Alphaproteobacteria bacterium]|nr:FAD-binding oxidoreductase [Alphaproteobacteria bacterium]
MQNSTIISITQQTPDIRIFRIKTDQPFEFIAGQFAVFEMGGVKRAYTIASAPNPDYLEFIIVLVPGGALTTQLWKLGVGDRLAVTPKAFGHITIEKIPKDSPILMLATGTGIAMMRSMIQAGAHRDRKVVLVSGARFAADLGYRDEFDNINNENFTAIQLASREEYKGKQGRITLAFEDPDLSKLLPALDPSTGLNIVMCGGPDMIDALVDKFTALGFTTNENLHFEKY